MRISDWSSDVCSSDLTAGEAIGPDIFNFYRSLGLNLKQLYGMTEASVFVTMQPDGAIKPDTVGTPAPEVEIRMDEGGEVLFRSPGVFREYFQNPEATAETKTAHVRERGRAHVCTTATNAHLGSRL